MLNITFTIFWLFSCATLVLFFRIAGYSFYKITIMWVFFLYAALYQIVGLPILFYRVLDYRVSAGVDDLDIIAKVAFGTFSSLFLVLLGASSIKKFTTNRYVWLLRTKSRKLSTLILFIISTFVLFLYINTIGLQKIALLAALGFTNLDPILARSLMQNEFTGNYNWFELFMRTCLMFVAFLVYADFLRNKSSKKLFFIFSIIVILNMFSLLMATEKYPILEFIIGLFLVNRFVICRGNIRLVELVLLLIFLLFLVGIFYMLFMGSKSFLDSMYHTFLRLITGQIQPAYHYIEYFPDRFQFLYGRSFPNPGGLLPFEPFALTAEVARIKNEEVGNVNVVGSAPTIFWAELYANFSWFGVAVISFWFGILIKAVDLIMERQLSAGVLGVAFYVMVILHYKNLALTSASSFILDVKLISFLVIILCIYNLSFVRKR